MIHLNQPLYGPENAQNGTHEQKDVKSLESLRNKISNLERKIQKAREGRLKKAPSVSQLAGWESQLADFKKKAGIDTKQEEKDPETTVEEKPVDANTNTARLEALTKEIARLDIGLEKLQKNQPAGEEPGLALQRLIEKRDAAIKEKEELERGTTGSDKKDRVEGKKDAKHLDRLQERLTAAKQTQSAAHMTGQDSLYIDNPKLDRSLVDLRAIPAEIAFLEGGGTVEAWKKSPAYDAFKREYAALETNPRKIKVDIPSEEELKRIVGRITSYSLDELVNKQKELRDLTVQIQRAEKKAREEGSNSLAQSGAIRRGQIQSALTTIEVAIATKRRGGAESKIPSLQEVELIASYQRLEDLKSLLGDNRIVLDNKKKQLEVIQRQLKKWIMTIGTDGDVKKSAARSIKITITDKLRDIDNILAEIESKDKWREKSKLPDTKKTPEDIINEKHDTLLEQIRDGHAVYGRGIEDLSMSIRADKEHIAEYGIVAAEDEIRNLLDLINDRGIKALLNERKDPTPTNQKGAPYFKKYLEHIRAKTDVLLTQIKYPNNIKRKMEEEVGRTINTTFQIAPSELPKLKRLEALLLRFTTMCNECGIKAKKVDPERDPVGGNEVLIDPAPATTPRQIPVVNINTPPAAWPRNPNQPPVTQQNNPPPIQPAGPVPPPIPPPLKMENIVIYPANVRAEIEEDNDFVTWYKENGEIFDSRQYERGSVEPKDLEDWYAQYQNQIPTLRKTKEFLAEGRLDKALGIKSENLDKASLQNLRDRALTKLQYSLFERGPSAREALDQVLRSVQEAKQRGEEIKKLEAVVAAREKVLNLHKSQKADATDVMELVVEDKPQFMRDNIDTVQAFVDDMRNNFEFYAKAAPSLKADGAQDKIFDRYAAARGRDSLETNKLGWLEKLGVRAKAGLNKINIFKKAGSKVIDILTRAEMSQRQEDKNNFWQLMNAMKKHQLVPTVFNEGARVQAAQKMDMLQQYINETFNKAPATLKGEDKEKAAKMFDDMYTAAVNNETGSMAYQEATRKTAKTHATDTVRDKEEISFINTAIEASDDWISRAMGLEQPEVVAETKEALFMLEAENFEIKVKELKVTENIQELKETSRQLKKMEDAWNIIAGEASSATGPKRDQMKKTHLAFIHKTQELELMKIKKSVSEPSSRVPEVVARRMYVLQNIDGQVMSTAEKTAAAAAVITAIEQRLARGGFNPITRQRIVIARDQLAAVAF